MASSLRTTLRRRLGILIVGAVAATVLTAATAAAAPAPMQVQAAGPTRPDSGPAAGTGTPPPGFLLERGRFKPVALPPGLEDLTLRGIAPVDLNDRRQIVGTHEESIGGAVRGFLLDKQGRFTKINPPGAKGTQPQGINDRGQIVGEYQDTDGHFHGDVWERGRFRTLPTGPPPGSTTAARSPA
jgi:hypothetical protein